MVAPGQFLERPTLIPVGPSVLEGLWHKGRRGPAVLIVPPLPGTGGGMDHVLAAECAFVAASSGRPSLRFNFRGVGASQGKVGGLAACAADLRSALATLAENAPGLPQVIISLASAAQLLPRAPKHFPLLGAVLLEPTRSVEELAGRYPHLLVLGGNTADPSPTEGPKGLELRELKAALLEFLDRTWPIQHVETRQE